MKKQIVLIFLLLGIYTIPALHSMDVTDPEVVAQAAETDEAFENLKSFYLTNISTARSYPELLEATQAAMATDLSEIVKPAIDQALQFVDASESPVEQRKLLSGILDACSSSTLPEVRKIKFSLIQQMQSSSPKSDSFALAPAPSGMRKAAAHGQYDSVAPRSPSPTSRRIARRSSITSSASPLARAAMMGHGTKASLSSEEDKRK